MKIIKRDPFDEIERFINDQDMFGFFPAVRRHMVPPVDMYHDEKNVIVEMHVPHVDPSGISISVEDGMLKIEGETSSTDEKEGREYYRKEIRSGSFSRMISLPVAVKEDEARASFEKGILRITIPKEEVKQPKKVDVEVK